MKRMIITLVLLLVLLIGGADAVAGAFGDGEVEEKDWLKLGKDKYYLSRGRGRGMVPPGGRRFRQVLLAGADRFLNG